MIKNKIFSQHLITSNQITKFLRQQKVNRHSVVIVKMLIRKNKSQRQLLILHLIILKEILPSLFRVIMMSLTLQNQNKKKNKSQIWNRIKKNIKKKISKRMRKIKLFNKNMIISRDQILILLLKTRNNLILNQSLVSLKYSLKFKSPLRIILKNLSKTTS